MAEARRAPAGAIRYAAKNAAAPMELRLSQPPLHANAAAGGICCPHCGGHIAAPAAPFRPSKTWSEVRAELEKLYAPPNAAVKTWRKLRYVLERLPKYAPTPASLTDIAVAEFRTAMHDRKLAEATIGSVDGAVRRIANYLLAKNVLTVDPMNEAFTVRRRRSNAEGRRRKTALSREQMAKVLLQADKEWAAAEKTLEEKGSWRANQARFKAARTRALAYLIAYTGVRALEALHCRWQDLDFDGGVFHVGEAEDASDWRTKTDSSRNPVALPARAVEVLREWQRVAPRGSVWTFRIWESDKPWLWGNKSSRPVDVLKSMAARGGVPGVTMLRLRHTWATIAANHWGMSPLQIQLQLRHDKEKTQEAYRKFDVGELSRNLREKSF